MRRAGLVPLRWTAAAVAAVVLALPRLLGAQVPTQGIKVHGHWVIEVRDADGTLRVRREFENGLLVGGRLFLAQLLGGQRTMGDWIIIVAGSNNLCNSGGTAFPCRMVEPSSAFPADGRTFKNLTRQVTFLNELLLQGSFVVGNSGSVTSVLTEIDPPGSTFTATSLPSPIPVEATQTVSVTVTISFS